MCDAGSGYYVTEWLGDIYDEGPGLGSINSRTLPIIPSGSVTCTSFSCFTNLVLWHKISASFRIIGSALGGPDSSEMMSHSNRSLSRTLEVLTFKVARNSLWLGALGPLKFWSASAPRVLSFDLPYIGSTRCFREDKWNTLAPMRAAGAFQFFSSGLLTSAPPMPASVKFSLCSSFGAHSLKDGQICNVHSLGRSHRRHWVPLSYK